jgi:hypothetical protein
LAWPVRAARSAERLRGLTHPQRANSVTQTLLAMKRRMAAAHRVIRCDAPIDRRSMHPLIGDGSRTDFGALQALSAALADKSKRSGYCVA